MTRFEVGDVVWSEHTGEFPVQEIVRSRRDPGKDLLHTPNGTAVRAEFCVRCAPLPPPSWNVLPVDVLTRMLAGMLSTYYRSRHRQAGHLRSLTKLKLRSRFTADVVIVQARDAAAGKILAAYKVITTKTPEKTLARYVAGLHRWQEAHRKAEGYLPEVAIVTPLSRESEAKKATPIVVSYPG